MRTVYASSGAGELRLFRTSRLPNCQMTVQKTVIANTHEGAHETYHYVRIYAYCVDTCGLCCWQTDVPMYPRDVDTHPRATLYAHL